MNTLIGFSSPKKFKIGAELIKLWQGRTTYSHVYLKVYSNYTEEWLVYQASHGMVNCTHYDNFLAENMPVVEIGVYISPDNLRATIKKAQTLLGRDYGTVGLLKLVIYRIITSTGMGCASMKAWGDGLKTFHCSEFLATLLPEYAHGNPDYIEPVHIYNKLQSIGLIA